MALNLDDLIMSDEDDVASMKEPPLFIISKDIKRNSNEDDSLGSDSSYCEFAKESAKKMSSLIGEVQLAKIEKNKRISDARKQKKKELDEKKNVYQHGKNFNKKDNSSNSGIKKSSSSKNSDDNKTVISGNVVQTFCDIERNKSSNSAKPNQNLNKDANQQQKKNKTPPKNIGKINEKTKTKSNLTSKSNNITIQDFGIDSTDSSDYESDNSSNNLSDNELLKSRAAAKLFTVKNLNESSFYFVDVDSSSDSDNGKKNIRHFQTYGKRMAASKRNKNLNKKRINYNKNNVETDDTNASNNTKGNFFLKDNIVENQNKIIPNDKTTENRNKIISKDKTHENRCKTKLDQNPSTSKQIIQNQDGKIQSNFIPSTSKSLLQDLFEQTRRKNTDKSSRNTTNNQKYDESIDQSNDKEVKNKNNLIKNEVEKQNNNERNTVKADKQESDVKSKDSTKKNKKKKELKSSDEVKNVGKTKSTDEVKKIEKETKSTDGVKQVENTKSTDGVKKVRKRKETKSTDQVEKTKESKSTDGVKKVGKTKETKSTDQVKKFENTKEQKWKAVEQREMALAKVNNQRIFNKNKFDSNDPKFDDDIVILSEIKLNQNKPETMNKIDDSINITKKIDDSINIDEEIDDSINIDNLILDSFTSSSYHHDKMINSSNIADKSKINESDSESDIDFNTILNERKKKIENVITGNKIVQKSDSTVGSNLKFKSKDVSNESSSDLEAEFEASLQFNYRNKLKK